MKIIYIDNGYSSDNLFILENGMYYGNEEMIEFTCAPHIERYEVHYVNKKCLGRVGMMLASDDIDNPDEWLKAFDAVYYNREAEF